MYRQESDNVQTSLAGEAQLLELICAGAPLAQILDTVCTGLDVRVGNVVSLVLLPDDGEHTLHKIAHSAAKFGLSAFSCAPVLSPSGEFLGTLETYCCFCRKPTLKESELIECSARLAAFAIQHYKDELETEDLFLDWAAEARKNDGEKPSPSN